MLYTQLSRLHFLAFQVADSSEWHVELFARNSLPHKHGASAHTLGLCCIQALSEFGKQLVLFMYFNMAVFFRNWVNNYGWIIAEYYSFFSYTCGLLSRLERSMKSYVSIGFFSVFCRAELLFGFIKSLEIKANVYIVVVLYLFKCMWFLAQLFETRDILANLRRVLKCTISPTRPESSREGRGRTRRAEEAQICPLKPRLMVGQGARRSEGFS